MARSFVRHMLILAFVGAWVTGLMASPARAHVDVVSSDPMDGSVVTEAPAVVTVTFSVDAALAGDGVVLRSADGSVVEASIAQLDSTIVTISPVATLANGSYQVSWTMKAGDAHPTSGVIGFQVRDPNATVPEETVVLEPTVGENADAPGGFGSDTLVQSQELDSRQRSTSAGDWLSRIGRWVAMTGGLVAIGAFALGATSLIGTRQEVRQAGFWVRRAGVFVVLGTLIEALGASMVAATLLTDGFGGGAISETVSGPFGIALLLRVVGGLVMLRGTTIATSVSGRPKIIVPLRFDPDGGGGTRGATTLVSPPPTQYRLDVHREGIAFVGMCLFVASYLFDGHTVVAEPAIVVRVATVAHIAAGGVWLGGVLLMAHILSSRHRNGMPLEASGMAIRFSVVASVALATVAIAGAMLAVSILDGVSELFVTAWGRLLLVKLFAVAAAASIGAYNHFVVIPLLEADPTNVLAEVKLKQLVRRESIVLVVIVAITAILVGAAS